MYEYQKLQEKLDAFELLLSTKAVTSINLLYNDPLQCHLAMKLITLGYKSRFKGAKCIIIYSEKRS